MLNTKKHRDKYFPEVVDFTDSMDRLRYAPTRELSFIDFFWYKPIAHKIINLGLWINGFIVYAGIGLWFAWYKHPILAFFFVVLGLLCLASFFKKWRTRAEWGMLSFYDVYIRDYEGDIV